MKTAFLTNGDFVNIDFIVDYKIDYPFLCLDITYGDRNDTNRTTFKTIRHTFETREMMEASIKLIKELL